MGGGDGLGGGGGTAVAFDDGGEVTFVVFDVGRGGTAVAFDDGGGGNGGGGNATVSPDTSTGVERSVKVPSPSAPRPL